MTNSAAHLFPLAATIAGATPNSGLRARLKKVAPRPLPHTDGRTQHLQRMRAVAGGRSDDLVFVGGSAAAVWGLPMLGAWPPTVEALAGRHERSRQNGAVSWRRSDIGDDDLEAVGPWFVTTLARTLCDLAVSAPFVAAVSALDHGLKPTVTADGGRVYCGVEREELIDLLRRRRNDRGRTRALAAIGFADPAAASSGESLSRVQAYRLGFPPPLLHPRVDDERGAAEHPHFEWQTAYGEFDGVDRYARALPDGARPTADVIWNERRREDRLRGRGKAVARWTWEDAWNPPRLRSILLSVGVRPVRRAAFSPDAFGEWVMSA
ncbi:hypothetical protein [Leifsonia poae]|uniref:hypothetical protein n=1 Tax=Leifsonia poae TaxID=110933 RepID=UPI001CBA9D33|nr:hypothetical protein [Leifsonia poae]